MTQEELEEPECSSRMLETGSGPVSEPVSSIRDELADSNRRIEELARALQAEKERAAAAEAAILHKDVVLHASSANEKTWSAGVVDARMFMRKEPVLTERAAFQRLPSVVTWFSADKQHSLFGMAVRHDRRTGAGVGALAPQPRPTTTGATSEVQISLQEVRELREHESHVWCCALHPLVPLVATGSSDTTIRLWRLDGECLRVLRGHKEWVYCLAFDPMGDILCSGAFDGTLRLWNVSNGECMRIIRRPGISFHSVAFQVAFCFLSTCLSRALTSSISASCSFCLLSIERDRETSSTCLSRALT